MPVLVFSKKNRRGLDVKAAGLGLNKSAFSVREGNSFPFQFRLSNSKFQIAAAGCEGFVLCCILRSMMDDAEDTWYRGNEWMVGWGGSGERV